MEFSSTQALERYEALLKEQPSAHFLNASQRLPLIDERFFHLKEISRTNLASLVEGETTVPGEWAHQFVEEEELDLTLQQMLADASGESKLSLVVGEEGQGKTALLRYISLHISAIIATGNPNAINGSYVKSFAHRPPVFAVYVQAPILHAGFVERNAKGSENPQQALEVLIDAAVKSWLLHPSRLIDSASDTEKESEFRVLLTSLLQDSEHPYVLLVDNVDPLHPLVAYSLLESFLYGPKQGKRKEDYPPSFETESERTTTKVPLYDFGKHLREATKQRLNRVVATCRYSTLTNINEYDVKERMEMKREFLKGKASGKQDNNSSSSKLSGLPLPPLFDPNLFEEFDNQWRVLRMEPLTGDGEEDQFMKSLLSHWGVGTETDDPQPRILLALLNERKQRIFPPNRRSPLALFLLTRDITRSVSEGEERKKKDGFEDVFMGADGFPGVSNSQYELMNNLVRDILRHSLGLVDGESEDKALVREKRILLSLFAFLVFWWEETVLQVKPLSKQQQQQPQLSGVAVVGQREFVEEMMRVYYKDDGSGGGRDYFEEALSLLPGDLLCERVPPEQRVAFKYRPFHQFLTAEFVTLWYYIATNTTRGIDRTLLLSTNVSPLPSIEDMKAFSKTLTERSGLQPNPMRNLWGDAITRNTATNKKGGTATDQEERSLPIMAWEEDPFIAHAWWSEVLMFVSFHIAIDDDTLTLNNTTATESPTASPSSPSPVPSVGAEGGKALAWMFYRLIGQHNGDNLASWLTRVQKYGTDPVDLGQVRFTHLLRAKACEGLVIDIKGITKPAVKKTELGRTLLDMMDDSEMALLHVEDYPVYLQVPHCLGRKGCGDILDRCVMMMETSNFIYATEIILRLGLGDCLGEFDANESKEVKESCLTARLVRLLKDQEPRTRKAVVGILWKICVQSFSPFYRFAQTKRSNKGQLWVEEKDRIMRAKAGGDTSQQQGGAGTKLARTLLGLKRLPSMKNETKSGTGAELVNRIVAMLKDNHASVQDDAVSAMRQLADLSISLLTADQQQFFINELLPIVEDSGEVTGGGGKTEWRHLVNSAISVMKMFDLYEWLMRWLSHDQCGMRLLVFTALGLLGYPLVETKQKFDPVRKASTIVLSQLSEGYTASSPPEYADFVNSINERVRVLKGGASTPTTPTTPQPGQQPQQPPPQQPPPPTKARTDEEDDLDEDTCLMLPFRVIIYHSFGDVAAKCPDLDWMMNLLKCKAAFIHRMSFVFLKHFIDESVATQRLSSLLTFNSGGGGDKDKVVAGIPANELTASVKSEVVKLLSKLGNERELERLGKVSLLRSRNNTHNTHNTHKLELVISGVAIKHAVTAAWLREDLEREAAARERLAKAAATPPLSTPAIGGGGSPALLGGGGIVPLRQRSFSVEEQQNRALKLEMVAASIPAFGFRLPEFGFAFLASASLTDSAPWKDQPRIRKRFFEIGNDYWDFLLLLLDVLDVENADFVVEETAATKLHEISKNVVRIAFVNSSHHTPSPLLSSTTERRVTEKEKEKEKEKENDEREKGGEEEYKKQETEKERTMQAVDTKCFKLLNHSHASVVLSVLRLLSSLLVLRNFSTASADTTTTTTTTTTTPPPSDSEEAVEVTAEEGGKEWKEIRQRQIVSQAMSLLTHRDAGIRNEAIDLLSIFIERKKNYHKQRMGEGTGTGKEEGLGGTLDMEEHMVVLCSMLRTHIYFVRATALTVLGIFIQYFIDSIQSIDDTEEKSYSLSELKKLDEAILKVLQTAQKDDDGMVMESATRALGLFREYISEEALKVMLSLVDHPSRLRVAVVETLGRFGPGVLPVVPRLIHLLKTDEDNWLRTVATNQLTKILAFKPIDSPEIVGYLNGLSKLLQEDEYYVKESCLQLLSALGPKSLRHCIDPILAILDDEDEEEETCVTEIALLGIGQLLAYEKEHIPAEQRKSDLYLSHIMPKLEDSMVSVKKAALKAMRKDPSLVANNEAVLARLTKLVNTFAEETTVQIQAFILIGEAGKLSVFNHLSPLLSLLHSKDTKVLMKTVNALALLGAKSAVLMPCAINRTKSHEMRRRLLSLLIKYQTAYDGCYCIDTETGAEDGDNVKQQRREVAFLFKHRDATLRRFAFKTLGTYYEIRAGHLEDDEGSGDSSGGEEDDEDEEEDVVVFASDYWRKYRRAIMLMLKDQTSRKSRMEAVLALARITQPAHAKAVLRRLFPPVCKKPLIRSVAVWRLLSYEWSTLIDTP